MSKSPSYLLRTVALAVVLSLAIPQPVFAQTAHLHQDANGRLEPDLNVGMSPEEQMKIGQQAAAQARKQLPVLPDDSQITRYLARMGQRLAAKAPGYKWPFEFHVVNQKEINAFALPGGPMFVNVGTIQAADENELAGVMAHEMSHVVMQHTAREAGKQQGIGVLGALGGAIAGAVLGGGIGGQLAQLGIQMGAAGVVMKYSRTAETEADLMGAQLMYDAGYNPYAMVEFFTKLEKEGGSSGPQFLSDHPNPGNRAESVQKVIARFPKKDYPRSDSSEFAAMKNEAMRLHPLTAQEIAQRQKSGKLSNASESTTGAAPMSVNAPDIRPASSMEQFRHGSYNMSFPSNWTVFGKPGEQSVVIAPQAGVSQDAIAYGVSINLLQVNNGGSMDDLTNQIIQALQRSNPDMRAVGTPSRVRVNGRTGRSVDLMSTSPLADANGGAQRERDWLVTLPQGSNAILSVVFIAPEREFSSLRPSFQKMLKSLKISD